MAIDDESDSGKSMVVQSTGPGVNHDKYYSRNKKNDDILTPLIVLGGFTVLGYILNNKFLEDKTMGTGRILNNRIYNYAQGIQDLSDTPNFKRGIPNYKGIRTSNITYPDILYEGVRRQPAIDNAYVNYPMPASDDTLLTYAEPSNIVTDDILYEQGNPDIREDMKLTGLVPYGGRTQGGLRGNPLSRRTPGGIDAGASNTIITTEYAPGISEKIRKENPLVVTKAVTPTGKTVTKVARLAPLRPSRIRKFNTDYDDKGNLVQKNPVYDTVDYLSDLKLTNEDFKEGRPLGGNASAETIAVWEDFLKKGTIKAGYEVIPSDD